MRNNKLLTNDPSRRGTKFMIVKFISILILKIFHFFDRRRLSEMKKLNNNKKNKKFVHVVAEWKLKRQIDTRSCVIKKKSSHGKNLYSSRT